MSKIVKALTIRRTLEAIALILTATGATGLYLWSASGPILTYDTSNTSFEWGPGSSTSHIDVRLRNQGWQSASSYTADITVSGAVISCFVEQNVTIGPPKLIPCDNVVSGNYQPCNAQNTLILWNNSTNVVTVISSTFPAGCDFTLWIDSAGFFPTGYVSGKSDQGSISKSVSVNQLIIQRDWTLRILIACFLLLVSIAVIKGLYYVYCRLGHPTLKGRRMVGVFPYIVVCLAIAALVVWYVRTQSINSFNQSVYNLTMQHPDYPIGPPYVYSTLFADYYCGGLTTVLEPCAPHLPLGAIGYILDALLILSVVAWGVVSYRERQ